MSDYNQINDAAAAKEAEDYEKLTAELERLTQEKDINDAYEAERMRAE